MRRKRRILSLFEDGRKGSDRGFDHGVVSAYNRVTGDSVPAGAVELGAGFGDRTIAGEHHDFQHSQCGGLHDGLATLCIGAGSVVGYRWFAAEDFDEQPARIVLN